MLNHYETVFILTPILSEQQAKDAVTKFCTLLEENGSQVAAREEWGMRRLAYPIEGKSSGLYVYLQFDCEPSVIATLETAFRRDERIMRFLTTKLDKYAYEYALRRMHKEEAQQ